MTNHKAEAIDFIRISLETGEWLNDSAALAQAHATLALADATTALVAAQNTANRILWTSRPGHAPGPGVREYIDRELGL